MYEMCLYLKDITDTDAIFLLTLCALFLVPLFSDFGVSQNCPEGLLNRFPSPAPRASDLAGPGWSLRMCNCPKLPGEEDAADPRTTL